MKRSSIAVLAAVLLFPAATLWSQGSLMAQNSFGLFPNALDAAFSVQEHPIMPSFSSLGSNYLFAGLANLDALRDAEGVAPFKAGWYGKGDHPWMLSLSGRVQTAGSGDYADGVSDRVYSDIVDGASSTFSWLASELLSTYDYSGAVDAGGELSFIRGFGPFNLGAILDAGFSRGDAGDLPAWMAANKTTVENHYYNAAGVDVTPPQPLLDYTKTTSASSPKETGKASLDLPLFFKAGKVGSFLTLSLKGGYREFGSAATVLTSVPVDATGSAVSYADVSASTSDMIYSVGGGLDCTVSLPPLVWTDDANETLISASFGYDWNAAKDKSVSSQTTTGSATTAAGKVQSGLVSTASLSERDIADRLTGGLGFGQSFYYSLAPECYFAFKPWLALDFEQGPDPDMVVDGLVAATVFKSTETTIDSGSATAYKTVVTTEYLDEDGPGIEWKIGASFALPTSLKVKPSGWPLAFILSSKSSFRYDLVLGTNEISREQKVTQTYATSAVTEPSVATTYPASYSKSEAWLNQDWGFATENGVGLSLELPAKISLDLAATWTGLFDFEDIELQMVVPLP